jgi:Immunoglobulin-like domain of bacterial spore germination
MSDRTEFMHPDFEPGEFDQVERALRHALSQEATRMRPTDRLDGILRASREAGPAGAAGGSGTRRWLVPVAAAAAVAAIAGGLWAAGQDQPTQPTPPATSGPSAGHTTPPATGSASSTASTTAPTGARAPATLPVYFVGPIGDAKPTYKLFREFVRGSLPKNATDAEKAKAALVLAINAQPYSNTDGYLQPWSGETIGDVIVTPTQIIIALANSGAEGFDAETGRLAVQELVWTAQAAVGKGTIPVTFIVADGSTELFGRYPVSQTYTRPAADQAWVDLAPIWVTTPSRGAVLPASKSVMVTGDASVFEATLAWELRRGATVVKHGTTMAAIGAPGRGPYSISLGKLAAGTYSIRVWEASAKDGSVAAERDVTFSVR